MSGRSFATGVGSILLHGGAGHAAVRAEDAAVARFRAERGAAGGAVPEELAAFGWHFSLGRRAAFRARDRGRGLGRFHRHKEVFG